MNEKAPPAEHPPIAAVMASPEARLNPVVRAWLVIAAGLLTWLLQLATPGGEVLLLGFILVALLPSILRGGSARLYLFEMETFVPLMYWLAGCYAPLARYLSSWPDGLQSGEVSALRILFMGAVACSTVCTSLSRSAPHEVPSRPPGESRTSYLAIVVVSLAGIGMISSWILLVGLRALFSMNYGETYLAERGFGFLTAGWYFVQFGSVCVAIRVFELRKSGAPVPVFLWTLLGAFVLCFIFPSFLGRRGPIVWVLIAIMIGACMNGIRLKWTWVLAGALAIFVYGFFLEGARWALGEEWQNQLLAGRKRIELVENPMMIPELDTVFTNLETVVAYQPRLVDYPGESWLSAFLQQIPVSLWEGRPKAMAERFVMWSDPAIDMAGGGLGFGAATEGYLNFGLVGVFLQIGMMTLVFFAGPYAACLRRRRPTHVQALCACLSSFTYIQFRTELASMVKTTLILVFATLLATVLSMAFPAHSRHSKDLLPDPS